MVCLVSLCHLQVSTDFPVSSEHCVLLTQFNESHILYVKMWLKSYLITILIIYVCIYKVKLKVIKI